MDICTGRKERQLTVEEILCKRHPSKGETPENRKINSGSGFQLERPLSPDEVWFAPRDAMPEDVRCD